MRNIPQKAYLVTGCAGFIGYHVVENLLNNGCKVLGVDSMYQSPDLCIKDWRLSQLEGSNGFIFCRINFCDVHNFSSLITKALDSIGVLDGVIHLGGRAGIRQSVSNPLDYYESNVLGTLNVLEFCRAHGIKKFVFASSSSLYSGVGEMPFSESVNTDRPISPYAASKKAAEELCFSYHYLHGMDITVFRFFSVYGPAGRPDMSPFRFIQSVIEGVPLTFFGNGTQQRDFTYIEDIVNGIIKGLKPLGYEIINLGSGRPISLKNLVRRIESITGKRAEVCYSDPDQADVKITHACIKKAYSKIEWAPRTDLDSGLKTCIRWYEKQREWVRRLNA
jgi:nucleoside-diphosphate-sugar epimerase